MSNVSTERGIFDVGPRHAVLGQRPGYNAGDVAWGFCYAEFGSAAEFIVVVQPNGAAAGYTAKVYSVTANGASWTDITPTPPFHASDWSFVQYEDKIFASNATAGTFWKTVGDPAWTALAPNYHGQSQLTASTNRPIYPTRAFTADTVSCEAVAGFTLQSVVVTSDGQIRCTDQRTGSNFATRVIVATPTGVDWSSVDWVYFTLTGGNLQASKTYPVLCGFSETVGAAWSALTQIAPVITNELAGVSTVIGGSETTLECVVDLRSIEGSARDAIRTIGFQFTAGSAPSTTIKTVISAVSQGGRDMLQEDAYGVDPTAPTQDYAYAYFTTATSELGPATKASVATDVLRGTSLGISTTRMGAWVQLDAAAFGAPDKVKFYRKVGSKWFFLGMVNNSGSPQWIDKQRRSDFFTQTPVPILQFGSVSADLAATAIGVWKSHLALAVDRKCYLSWGGLPNEFLPDPAGTFIAPSSEDAAQGATFYVANDRSANMIGIVAQDALFLGSSREVYAVIGDSALDSTPPRKLPGSRGLVGPRALSRYGDGILVGASDGLWFYNVSRGFTGSKDGTYVERELTYPVRTSWETLLGSEASRLVLVEETDAIWAFVGSRYLRLTRPCPVDDERRWESGTWTGMSVRCAHYHPSTGLCALTDSGTLHKVAAAYKTDAGVAVALSYTTGTLDHPRSSVSKVEMIGAGTPSLAVLPFQGRGALTPVSFVRASGGTYPEPGGQVFLPQKTSPPGWRHSFVVTGVAGRDTVEKLTIWLEEAGPGAGN